MAAMESTAMDARRLQSILRLFRRCGKQRQHGGFALEQGRSWNVEVQ